MRILKFGAVSLLFIILLQSSLGAQEVDEIGANVGIDVGPFTFDIQNFKFLESGDDFFFSFDWSFVADNGAIPFPDETWVNLGIWRHTVDEAGARTVQLYFVSLSGEDFFIPEKKSIRWSRCGFESLGTDHEIVIEVVSKGVQNGVPFKLQQEFSAPLNVVDDQGFTCTDSESERIMLAQGGTFSEVPSSPLSLDVDAIHLRLEQAFFSSEVTVAFLSFELILSAEASDVLFTDDFGFSWEARKFDAQTETFNSVILNRSWDIEEFRIDDDGRIRNRFSQYAVEASSFSTTTFSGEFDGCGSGLFDDPNTPPELAIGASATALKAVATPNGIRFRVFFPEGEWTADWTITGSC